MFVKLAVWSVALTLLSSPVEELKIAEPTAQAGNVYTGVPLSHRFVFQNVGSQLLRITDVHTHCGCSTPRLTELIYEPGTQGALDLEVLTLTQPAGPHTFSAHIE